MHGVYLSVSIDCECDKGAGWRVRRPLSFVGVVEGMARRLQPMFERRKAKPTYLLSAEVMRDEPSVEALRRLAKNAELGTHLHGELIEPDLHEPDVTAAFQRDYPPDVERAKLQNLTRLFHDVLGQPARSFRAGRFGIGPASIGILEELGYTVESSVTPFLDWSSKGSSGLSFVDAPTQPYRPDRRFPSRLGTSTLLEVPVTIRPRQLLSRIPGVGRLIEPRWLRPTWGSVASLVALAREEIETTRRAAPGRPVVLNAMFHNVEIVPGMSPYAADEKGARAILERLDGLLAFAQREGIRVVGLADLPELFA